jgi:hypothetical protein
MDKVLVDVFLPAAGKSFDVLLPKKSKLYEVSYLLAGAFGELANGFYFPTDDAILCSRDNGEVLNLSMSVQELGLVNGSRLILI